MIRTLLPLIVDRSARVTVGRSWCLNDVGRSPRCLGCITEDVSHQTLGEGRGQGLTAPATGVFEGGREDVWQRRGGGVGREPHRGKLG